MSLAVRFGISGVRLSGFIGHGPDGQPYLAVPLTNYWCIHRCDQYRFFGEVANLTPAELEDWSEKNSVVWADEGNGIALYSQDMVGTASRSGE